MQPFAAFFRFVVSGETGATFLNLATGEVILSAQRMIFEPAKGLLQSRAFIGLVVLFLGAMLDRFGYVVVDREGAIDGIINIVSIVMELIGAAVSTWGTVTRKVPIDGLIKFD